MCVSDITFRIPSSHWVTGVTAAFLMYFPQSPRALAVRHESEDDITPEKKNTDITAEICGSTGVFKSPAFFFAVFSKKKVFSLMYLFRILFFSLYSVIEPTKIYY